MPRFNVDFELHTPRGIPGILHVVLVPVLADLPIRAGVRNRRLTGAHTASCLCLSYPLPRGSGRSCLPCRRSRQRGTFLPLIARKRRRCSLLRGVPSRRRRSTGARPEPPPPPLARPRAF